MKIAILALLVVVSLKLTAQINYDNPPWNIGCDDAQTQTEMNSCSAKQVAIADSIMNGLANEIIGYLNTTIEVETKALTTENSEIKNDFITLLKKQVLNLTQSQKGFETSKMATLQIIETHYYGGSIMSLEINTMAMRLLIERIKLLETLKDTLVY